MKRVNIKQAIAMVEEEYGEDMSNKQMMLMRWAKYAELNIGGYYSYNRRTKKVVSNDLAQVSTPIDAIQVLSVLRGDYEDDILTFYDMGLPFVNQSESIYSFKPESNVMFWNSISYANYSKLPKVPMEFDGETINLPPGNEQQEFTIEYLGFELTKDGDIKVNESHIVAILNYLKYKIMDVDIFRKTRDNKLTRANDIELMRMYKRDYHKELKNARAEDSLENERLETDQALRYFTYPIIFDEEL